MNNSSSRIRDVIVIGAGVAGTLCARELARRGYDVLLVEAKKFPRPKVCGCCLNQIGQSVLDRSGLLAGIRDLGGQHIADMELRQGRSSYRWPVPNMLVTDRAKLDQYLAREAVQAGAEFRDATTAQVLPDQHAEQRVVRLERASSSAHLAEDIRARIVVVADGLTQSSLRLLPEFKSSVNASARIGVQSIVPKECMDDRFACQLTMVVGKSGYVGVAPVDEDNLDIAAAVDPRSLSRHVRPATIVASILEEAGIRLTRSLDDLTWLGTPPLSRRSNQCGADRIFVVGDALGYVEPFTGEGMGLALRSAELLQPIIERSLQGWQLEYIQAWQRAINQKLMRKQWICRILSRVTRSPRQAMLAGQLCSWVPPIRNWAARQVACE